MIIMSELTTRLLLREMRYSLARRTILDFLASVEACFVSWEIITIFMTYDHNELFFAIFLVLNLIQKSYRSGFYTGVSCPYAHILTYIATHQDKVFGMQFSEMTVRMFAQILGGLWAYRLNQSAWNFFLTPGHWYLSINSSYGNCWTFLKVPTLMGFFIGGSMKSNFAYLKIAIYLVE